jgi:hypothetical protein
VQIVNGRKKEQIGYFVPIALKDTHQREVIFFGCWRVRDYTKCTV